MAVRARNSLVDDVAEQLRDMILGGSLRAGEFLPPQKELAARYGVGLSTIHEALRGLTAVGLVQSRPGKGTWVRNDAMDTLIHPEAIKRRLGELNASRVCEARSAIEVALTEFAAERATDEQRARIWEALSSMEAALSAGDEAGFVEADLAFHLRVAEAGNNGLLEQFYQVARKLLSEIITEMVRLPNVKEKSIRLQRAIAQGIEQRDRGQARRAALKHMEYIAELLDIGMANASSPSVAE